jgi:hypothetical protein
MFLPKSLRPLRIHRIPNHPRRASRFIRLQLEGLEERITPTGPVITQAGPQQAIITSADSNAGQQYIIPLTNSADQSATSGWNNYGAVKPAAENPDPPTNITNITATPTTVIADGGTVTASATVLSLEFPVSTGSVVFTLTGPNEFPTITSAPAPVTNGTASAILTVPLGTPSGSYSLTATYNDPSGIFGPSSHTLPNAVTVETPATSISVTNVSTSFPNTDPTISLHAVFTVAAPGFPVNGNPVTEGQATFTIAGLTTQPITVPVVNGQANFSFAVPANSPVGVYTISVTYSDPAGNYLGSTGAGKLTIVPAPSTVTINNAIIVYGLFNEQETLSAVVHDPNGVVVNEGFVTFTEAGQTLSAPIVNGLATVTFTIPLMDENPFAHAIALAFSDPTGNFLSSTSSFILDETLFDFLLQMLAVSSLMQANASNS